MNRTRTTLAALGLLVLSTLAAPAFASADTPSMYDTCSASQQGQRISDASGDTLECVESGVGSGYWWEEPN